MNLESRVLSQAQTDIRRKREEGEQTGWISCDLFKQRVAEGKETR